MHKSGTGNDRIGLKALSLMYPDGLLVHSHHNKDDCVTFTLDAILISHSTAPQQKKMVVVEHPVENGRNGSQ